MSPTKHLSIQSKLILLLLLVSLGSLAAMAVVGYRSGQEALEQAVKNQLTSLCEAKKDQVRYRLEMIRRHMVTLCENPMVIDALRDFHNAAAKLHKGHDLKPDQEKQLQEFYKQVYLPALKETIDGTPPFSHYYPAAPWSKYLQFHYIAANPNPFPDKEHHEDAGDKSEYTAKHKKYHPLLSQIARSFKYDDLLLIDLDPKSPGDVLYSRKKTPEYANNLIDGPFRDSNLADVVKAMVKKPDTGALQFVDYHPYRPNYNKPAAFAVGTISEGERVTGLLVFEFSIKEFDDILTGDQKWAGLGNSGEVYLVGKDGRLRSESRFYLDNTDAYLEALARAGVAREQIKDIRRGGTTVYNQMAQNETIDDALVHGNSGAEEMKDYRGVDVVAAYAPLSSPKEEFPWAVVASAVVAKQDVEEAYAPIRAFRRLVGVTAVVTTLVVCVLAVALSALFVRPIHRLIEGARQVSAGQLEVRVEVPTKDEFSELADSFNQMTSSLKLKSALADRKAEEHERLLLSVLPAQAAARFREGEQQFSDSHADVTVLFAEVSDILDLTSTLSADRAVSLFDDIIVAFDESAQRHGVEKVKTVGSSYMAACGLTVQRIDHAHRMVEFAREMLRIVRHFNQERGTDLRVQASIHSGPVVGGVVGRTRFLYDLWGDTVNVARALQTDAEANTIRVTETVHDRLRDQHAFTGPEKAVVPGKGAIQVWAVVVE